MLLAQDVRLARRVGALTLLVMAAASAGFVFLFDRVSIGSPIRFRVMFRSSAGLSDDAPLVVAGQRIGRIAAVTPMLHGAPGPLAGDVGVAVTVEVGRDEIWKVPAAGTIFVASRGPFSERYLEVAPPAGDPGPPVADGAELRGADPPTLDRVLQHTWNNLTTFQQFVDSIGPALAALRDQLAALRGRLDTLAGDARTAAGPTAIGAVADATRDLVAAATQTYARSLGDAGGIARLQATVATARQTIAELRGVIDRLEPEVAAVSARLVRIRGQLAADDPVARAGRTLAALRTALDKIDPLLAAATDLVDRFARGEGSIGRLMTDPEFPEDTKELGKYLKRHPWKFLERPVD